MGTYQRVAPGGCLLSGEGGRGQAGPSGSVPNFSLAARPTSHPLQEHLQRWLREVGDLPAAHPSWCHAVNGTGGGAVGPALQRAWSGALRPQFGNPHPTRFPRLWRWKGPERGRARSPVSVWTGNKLREAKGVVQSHSESAGRRAFVFLVGTLPAPLTTACPTT